MSININYKNLLSYLRKAEICQEEDLDYVNIDSSESGTFNWLIELARNQSKIIIKQSLHPREFCSNNRVYKEWYLYNLLQSEKDLDYALSLTPKLLHFDKNNLILICQYSSEYITLKTYIENYKIFPTSIAKLLGINLAKLHYKTINFPNSSAFMIEGETGNFSYQLRYPDYISNYIVNRIEPETLKNAPVESWRFLYLFQQFENVREVVAELVFNHRQCCLTHNNINFNKLLIPKQWERLLSKTEDSNKSLIKVTDWEAYSWGDPACDLGKTITGYFLFWLNSMIVHPTIEIKQSIQLATIPLEIVHSSIVEMTKAYISTYPEILKDDPEFLKRVIQFAGLGLIYQVLAGFQIQPEISLSHQELYFYIATQLLCRPEKFLSI